MQHRLAVVIWGKGFDYKDPRGFKQAVEECVQWQTTTPVRFAWLDINPGHWSGEILSKDRTKQRDKP